MGKELSSPNPVFHLWATTAGPLQTGPSSTPVRLEGPHFLEAPPRGKKEKSLAKEVRQKSDISEHRSKG